MKKSIKYINEFIRPPLIVLLIMLITSNVIGQVTIPLSPKFNGVAKPGSNKGWIDFREGTTVNPSTIFSDLNDAFELKEGDEMRVKKTEKDNLGFTHYRYQQYYKNRKVIYGEYAVHQQSNGFVKSANGNIINGLNSGNIASVSEKNALDAALNFMNAAKYLWQNPAMEKELQRQENNNNATYFPNGELVYAPNNAQANLINTIYKLAWQFDIYTDDLKVAAKTVYVDALTGKVIHYTDIAMNCSGGTGTSAFNDNVFINASPSAGSPYSSHNDCQPTDIFVYNCRGGGPTTILYTDADNVWTDQSAVQAQYGAQMTYSYFMSQHSRASWNGIAGDMIVYNNSNHPFLGPNNACWGCTGNSAIFGEGSTSSPADDWNTVDIMGHEFTHGVTRSSANLAYRYESGALNESFSDIFGEMIESWAEGNCDYLVGADRGAFRSLKNPNEFSDSYAGIMPDTYLGTGWYYGSEDNGGVHHNSSVQNHWFYLLSEGGSGVNDHGKSFNVTGISRYRARLIAYRALTMYLTSSSQYIDSRAATLRAAGDLYGGCSPEMIAVGDAWHAVGVESQSAQFENNACGTYSSGEFVQAISKLTAADGCTVTINSPTDIVYFTARDLVVLYPGFKAVSGTNFVAYIEPCSSTLYRSSGSGASGIIMSDAEKGIKEPQPIRIAPPVELAATTFAKEGIVIKPNPFHSTVEVSINSKQNVKGMVYVFNSLGEKVKVIPQISLVKGVNTISFDGTAFKSGVYLIEIHMGDIKSVKKIVKL